MFLAVTKQLQVYNHHFLGWSRAYHDLHVAQENQDGSDLANRDAYMWLRVVVLSGFYPDRRYLKWHV